MPVVDDTCGRQTSDAIVPELSQSIARGAHPDFVSDYWKMLNSALFRVASRRLQITLLTLALCGCAYTLVHGGAVNQTKAQEIEQGLEGFRGLDFKTPVPLALKTREQALGMMRAEITRDHTDDEMRIGSLTGAMTGVYPAGMDLKAEALKLLGSQVAGFYDPHAKQMVLVEGGVDVSFWNSAAGFVSQRDRVGEMLLAHELTHALQDQHFHIEEMIDKVKDNDDRDLALKAVAEGDATLAGYGYVVGNLSEASLDAIIERMNELPRTIAAQSGGAPLGLTEPMSFQYADGVQFVADAYRRGGWAAVNAIYSDPPQATLQIMNPELYFDRRAQLVEINLTGYQNVLPDWTKADDDTYGALLLKIIIQRNLGMTAPEIALVEHWSGDRMIVLQKDRALTVLWIVSFNDGETARHFGEVYASILDRISPPTMPHRVEVKAPNVLIAIGDGARQFDRLAPAIWHASTIVRVTAAHAPTVDARGLVVTRRCCATPAIISAN
jgi:hypothetical protein